MTHRNSHARSRNTIMEMIVLMWTVMMMACSVAGGTTTISTTNNNNNRNTGTSIRPSSGIGSIRSKRWTRSTTKNNTRARGEGHPVVLPSRGGGAVVVTEKGNKRNAVMEGLLNSLASGLAAGCAKTLLAPFDTIKTVQQQHTGQNSLGLWEAATQICARKGGASQLYAGLGVSVVGSMPSVGLYFGVYSYCKRTLPTLLQNTFGLSTSKDDPDGKRNISDETLRTLSIALSAAIGNTVASFSRVPYEVVKQSLQTGVYTSTWTAIGTMFRQGGLRAFFPMGGVSIQMVRDIPYAVVTLLSYEYVRDHWVEPRAKKYGSSAWRDMSAGASAGGLGSYVTNPLDVIKTRLQTDSSGVYAGSITACANTVWQEGGAMAFLRGSVPRLLHKIPANGAFFVFYEFFRRLLQVD